MKGRDQVREDYSKEVGMGKGKGIPAAERIKMTQCKKWIKHHLSQPPRSRCSRGMS